MSLKYKICFLGKWITYILANPLRVKHMLPWFQSLSANTMNAQIPWFNYNAICYLEKIIKNNFNIFEYGSGGSTIYFAKRVKRIISVEYNKQWHSIVAEKINQNKLKNIELIFLPGKKYNKIQFSKQQEEPSYTDGNGNYQYYNFEEYTKSIDNYSDHFFDIIIIDGRARASCLFHAKNKVKKGGIIIIDDAERKECDSVIKTIIFSKQIIKYGPKMYRKHFSKTIFMWM